MGVEGRDLIDFGERKLHLLRQGDEMRGRQMTVMVLNEMQMLDQKIAPPRPVGEQGLDVGGRMRIDLAALGRARRPAPAGSPAPVRRQGRWLLGYTHFSSRNPKTGPQSCRNSPMCRLFNRRILLKY